MQDVAQDEVLRIEMLDLRIAPFDWSFARERRGSFYGVVADALEQRKAKLDFRVLQGAAHSRLRDVDHAGGRAHAAGEHHRVEHFNVS